MHGPQFWFAGFACLTSGMGPVAFRGRIPDWIPIAVANTVILAGVMVKTFGVLRFPGIRKPPPERLLVANVFFCVVASYALLALSTRPIRAHAGTAVIFQGSFTAVYLFRSIYARILSLAADSSDEEANLIADAAPMHDIGRIAVPDDILNKPSGLTPAEIELIRGHTTAGYQLLHKSDRAQIKMAATIALEHHEYWDGQGYPAGKSGLDIYLPAGSCVCATYTTRWPRPDPARRHGN